MKSKGLSLCIAMNPVQCAIIIHFVIYISQYYVMKYLCKYIAMTDT